MDAIDQAPAAELRAAMAPEAEQDDEPKQLRIAQRFDAPALSGTANATLARWLAAQVAGCQSFPRGMPAEECNERASAALAALEEIRPGDALEGLLGAQMVATHSAGLELMQRAMADDEDGPKVERQTAQAARLLGLFARQLDLLARQRGRQRRKVSIEHERIDEDGRLSVRAEAEQVR
jgi:hypothetical protein